MFMSLFLFFSMLLLCSFFRLKELFQVKNAVTTSLLFFLLKMPKIWVGRMTVNGEKKRGWANIKKNKQTKQNNEKKERKKEKFKKNRNQTPQLPFGVISPHHYTTKDE